MPLIKIRQSEQKGHDPIEIETGSEQKSTSGTCYKGIIATRSYYENSTGED